MLFEIWLKPILRFCFTHGLKPVVTSNKTGVLKINISEELEGFDLAKARKYRVA